MENRVKCSLPLAILHFSLGSLKDSYAAHDFVHLTSIRSTFSMMCQLDRLIAKAKEYRMPAPAMTDHAPGAVSLRAGLHEGIKPIIGCELYMAPAAGSSDAPDGSTKGEPSRCCADLGYKN
jgi:DNA polymerase III alpha subunit